METIISFHTKYKSRTEIKSFSLIFYCYRFFAFIHKQQSVMRLWSDLGLTSKLQIILLKMKLTIERICMYKENYLQ